ncbi:MAG TPA: DciA family protein [Woeseiaceae bacterium]|nr:DciA family protein [Woeseiaceae bacterium]
MPSEKLTDLLNPCTGGDLAELIGRARQMGALVDILCKSLPESDRAAIVAANVREDGEMIVICASSAWASRLRYENDRLLKAARDAGVKASSCRVRVSQNPGR